MKRLWNFLTPRKPAPLVFSSDFPAQHQKTARRAPPPQDKYAEFTPAGIEMKVADQLRYNLTALREISPALAVTVFHDVIEWLIAEGHWSPDDARMVLYLSGRVIPAKNPSYQTQAHSFARAEAGFGTDADEALDRADLTSGDPARVAAAKARTQTRLAQFDALHPKSIQLQSKGEQ